MASLFPAGKVPITGRQSGESQTATWIRSDRTSARVLSALAAWEESYPEAARSSTVGVRRRNPRPSVVAPKQRSLRTEGVGSESTVIHPSSWLGTGA